MQLPFLKNRKPEKIFFLSLLIKPERLGAILFEEVDGKLFILSTNETELLSDAENVTSENLLKAADRVITSVEVSMPAGANVEKTIFSVPYDWIEEGKIKGQHLEKLKKVCQDLGLIPVGYLTSIEAIVHLLDRNEGAPVSAIFVETGKTHAYGFVIRAGKILEFLSVPIEEGDVMASVESLFRKIESVDVLPSKIILASNEGAENLQQRFLSHKWGKDVPFLHLPQVVVLEKGFENEAVVSGVASQMELEVLSDVKAGSIEEEEPEAVLEEAKSDEFGFKKDSDIASEEPDANIVMADFKKYTGKEEEEVPDVSYFKEDKEDDEEAEVALPEKRKLSLPVGLSPVITSLKSLKSRLPSGIDGKKFAKPKLIGAVIILVLLIALVSFIQYNLLLKAEISVFADQRAIDKTEDITFAKDAEDGSIKFEVISEEVSGEDTKNATGTKETGEHAKGAVTVYNKTEDKKTFAKGTILVGPNGLEFEITDDINIASTSAFSTTLSSANAKVQAAKFGKEYNIPSGSNFTVKGFSSSDFIGKNSDAITGGTKETKTVVSEKDLTALRAQLIEKLEKEALAAAGGKVGGNEDIFPQILGSEVSNEKFSKKAGDESGSVSLNAAVAFEIGKYSKEEIQNLIKGFSETDVPGTYVLISDDSTTKIENIEVSKDGETASATLKVHAVYAPEINQDELSQALKSKSRASSEAQIRSIAGVSDVNIVFRNKLPLFPEFLPANPKNITFEVRN